MAYHVPEPRFAGSGLGCFLGPASVMSHLEVHRAHAAALNAELESIGASAHPRHISSVLSDPLSVPEGSRGRIGFYGGGYDNHSVYWESLVPGGSRPGPALEGQADVYYGGLGGLSGEIESVSLGIEGSGWCWLALDPSLMRIRVLATPGEQSPRSMRLVPLLGLDMWEHAHYLEYGPDRRSYVRGWLGSANWARAEALLAPLG
ncbi:MAG: Fe-Mn family superoxide dismutase [Nitrosopumilus sp.]|nr:Fe-Mn family superoxide dismutase [Nitrosopumilus sp.]MDA7943308.1 Fe-Mn family superoxide dismutase [Nitrosopumilus sp.]MDA7998291.1 Fe-Mn family superoxide dismutase [Nitrosopumilus sp.]MDA7998604.1 Fe-Mn family superoxide dismutase [Nitrosopumilus sp.]